MLTDAFRDEALNLGKNIHVQHYAGDRGTTYFCVKCRMIVKEIPAKGEVLLTVPLRCPKCAEVLQRDCPGELVGLGLSWWDAKKKAVFVTTVTPSPAHLASGRARSVSG